MILCILRLRWDRVFFPVVQSPKSDQIIRGRMCHFAQIAPRSYNHPFITNLNMFQDGIMRGSKDRQKMLKRNQIKGNNVWLLIWKFSNMGILKIEVFIWNMGIASNNVSSRCVISSWIIYDRVHLHEFHTLCHMNIAYIGAYRIPAEKS